LGENASTSIEVVNKLVAFMAAMVLAPIATFYLVIYIITDVMDYEHDRNVGFMAGGSAIVVVQLIMGFYVLLAFMEEGDETKPDEAAKKDKGDEAETEKDK